MAEEKIKQLHYSRGSLKSQLTHFEKILNDFLQQEKTNELYLNLAERFKRIEPIYDQFLAFQEEIEALNQKNLEVELEYRESFENIYFSAISKARLALQSHANTESTASPPVFKCAIKLPSINLPQFDGIYTNWLPFFDAFKSLIHSNNDLSEVEKLTYLKSSLKGEPFQLISTLETTSNNYQIAVDLLKERYDNRRRIINNHVHAILNTQIISRESAAQLKDLINTVQTHVNCLNSLDISVNQWDAILVPIVVSKLDHNTAKEWETKINNEFNNNQIPSLKCILEFLTNKLSTLETLFPRNQTSKVKSFVSLNKVTPTCLHCSKSHKIYNCEAFLGLDTTLKIKRVKELKLCFNCLASGHFTTQCKSIGCKKCNKQHHTLLHFSNNHANTREPTPRAESATTINCPSSNSSADTQTLLPTALVEVKDAIGTWHKARVLLDSGSQSNFITEELSNKLNLKKLQSDTNVVGIGKGKIGIQHMVNLVLKSCNSTYSTLLSCLVIPKITSPLPPQSVNVNSVEIPSQVKLADPNFDISQPIDLLIGSGLFWSLLCVGQIRQGNVIIHKTKLGWVVSGKLLFSDQQHNNSITCLSMETINNNVERFWHVDEFVSQKSNFLTDDEQYCEDYFTNTTERSETGRFIVRIPLKPTINNLGNSYQVALNRLKALENRFARDAGLKARYVNFINEYVALGHMTKIDKDNSQTQSFYLPHHCVMKESSDTTKLRVVFDGSCKLDEGLSINQVQFVGPQLQNDIFSIITKFRVYPFVLTGDIEKMYRQVLVHPDDRRYQRILWRENPQQPPDVYELNTITYGLTASPFLAIRSLLQVAIDAERDYPIESKVIREDFYVDDLITGANSIEQLKTIKTNVIKILQNANFPLRKFHSNSPELTDNDTKSTSPLIPDEEHKTLGILWNQSTDTFTYSLNCSISQRTISKRTILAITARLYDPLGLLAPIIVVAKLLIQELWQLKLTWDETVPMEIYSRWTNLTNKLHLVNKICIPRHCLLSDYNYVELHAFADASQRAYGACIYVRSFSDTREAQVTLLAAKSRVAPLKSITLPRLELCAAVLAAQLMHKFKQILGIAIDKEFFWSDSIITLCWLKGDPTRWKTFVANRVAEIQRLSDPTDWRHVSSTENPADLISRGVTPDNLIASNKWWNGPSWLGQHTSIFIDDFSYDSVTQIPDSKTIIQTCNVNIAETNLSLTNCSSLLKLKRVIAYCLRFKHNCLAKQEDRRYGPLAVEELHVAFKRLILLEQRKSFYLELTDLQKNGSVHPKSKLLSLTPFLDSENIIRVGGRLKLSNFNYGKKHPIILPSDSHLTKLIFVYEHIKSFHSGPKLLLANIREEFWPLSGKILAKRTVRKCVKCTRFNSTPVNPIMGNLPVDRTMAMYPFYSTGVDYAGPYLVKNRNGRGSQTTKAYVCLFICFSTKCVHLELVTDLSTKTFLLALKRFIARRGKPVNIISDNGSNFVGAKNELIELGKFLSQNTTQIIDFAHNEGVKWKFIPPRSPHFGGLWESGVRCMKHHLKRVLTNTPLTYEEFYTLLVNVESTLNSRPLTPLSSDPNDLEVLTPSHFLIGRTPNFLPDPDTRDLPLNRVTRYQLLQKLHSHFWDKWSKEFIHELQQRTKWFKSTNFIELNQLVLIKEDNTPPAQWKLGRITEIHPGKDNVVRVVTVKCSDGVYKRAVHKICVLPIELTP